MTAKFGPRGRWWAFAGGTLVAAAAIVSLTDAADQQPDARQTTSSDEPAVETAPERDPNVTVLALPVTLEDGALAGLRLKLLDSYGQSLKAWEMVTPGDLRLEAPKLEIDRYHLTVTSRGFATASVAVVVSADGIVFKPERVAVPRRRFAVLRYDVNVKGKRQLTGADVKHHHIAISRVGRLPDLNHDFGVGQDPGRDGGKDVKFHWHHFGSGRGVASPAAGKTYEQIEEAPTVDQYKPGDVVLLKGAIKLVHIAGSRPDHARYAKIMVEDVTETPPKDVKIIDKPEPW